MRYCGLLLLLAALVIPSLAQDDPEGPANEKARKTYKHALDDLQHHMTLDALDNFKKADKQDDGHCLGCQKKMIKYGIELRDWKTAETAGEEMIAEAQGDKALAIAHYELGFVLRAEALEKHEEEIFARAHQEMSKALATYANFPDAVFVDGQILAQLKQDDAAKAQFEQFVKMRPADDPDRQRALRYISAPDLARARMAPAFSVTTTDGQRVSLDELKGRVVLIDFWATWCGPCQKVLADLQELGEKHPAWKDKVVIITASMDDDKATALAHLTERGWTNTDNVWVDVDAVKSFHVGSLPTTYVIDVEGNIAPGEPEETIATIVDGLLGSK